MDPGRVGLISKNTWGEVREREGERERERERETVKLKHAKKFGIEIWTQDEWDSFLNAHGVK
jgi:hypothetical protein